MTNCYAGNREQESSTAGQFGPGRLRVEYQKGPNGKPDPISLLRSDIRETFGRMAMSTMRK